MMFVVFAGAAAVKVATSRSITMLESDNHHAAPSDAAPVAQAHPYSCGPTSFYNVLALCGPDFADTMERAYQAFGLFYNGTEPVSAIDVQNALKERGLVSVPNNPNANVKVMLIKDHRIEGKKSPGHFVVAHRGCGTGA